MTPRRLAVLAVLLAAGGFVAAGAGADAPTVADVWSRPAIQGGTGVVYMTIQGALQDDRLIGMKVEAAPKAELHVSTDDGGVMRMRPVAAIPIPAGQTVRLEPGGYHVMLPGLIRELKAGDSFPVTLVFERAGEVGATAEVRNGPGGSMGMQMDGPR